MEEVSSARSTKLICKHISHDLSFILLQLHNSEQLGLGRNQSWTETSKELQLAHLGMTGMTTM